MKKTILISSLVVLLAALPAAAQVDLSNYCALGDSQTAGFSSGSLMSWYQERSYPALLARQAGAASFEQPLISEPGIPAILELVSLQGPVIAPVGLIPGEPVNATYPFPYNNLGVPGATLFDMVFTTGDINNLLQGDFSNVMHDVVLRNAVNTALEQCIGLDPTFITVWIGNNDVLGAALAGTPIDGVTMTPVDVFAGLYANAIGALVTNTSADIVLINIPDRLPFFLTVPPFVDIPGVGTVPLMADTGPLTADDYVPLSAGALIAQGYGLPGGPPLPDNLDLLTGEPGYVLRAAEFAAIENQIAAYNQVIADVAGSYGLAVLDVNALYRTYWSDRAPFLGGVNLTGDFLLGGIFSYDGIHQQNIGYALIANALIELINAEFGASIPLVNMADVLYEGDWQDPGVTPSKAHEVVLSQQAFKQLYDLFGPKIEAAPRIRRPNSPQQPGMVAPDVRRAPLPRP
jgi:lysophospholipase L1-like esterase